MPKKDNFFLAVPQFFFAGLVVSLSQETEQADGVLLTKFQDAATNLKVINILDQFSSSTPFSLLPYLGNPGILM